MAMCIKMHCVAVDALWRINFHFILWEISLEEVLDGYLTWCFIWKHIFGTSIHFVIKSFHDDQDDVDVEGSWAWLGPPWEISVREWRHLNIETDKSAKMATRDQCLFYHLSLFPLTNTRYYCLNNWMMFFQMLSKIPDWFIMCRWKVQKNANHNNFCNLFLKCLLMDMRHPYHISIFAPPPVFQMEKVWRLFIGFCLSDNQTELQWREISSKFTAASLRVRQHLVDHYGAKSDACN